jgi:hypothetical protein
VRMCGCANVKKQQFQYKTPIYYIIRLIGTFIPAHPPAPSRWEGE